MKIKEHREKQTKYDPIAWLKCNICHQKYPNDEIVQHIHQKHPEKDCSTYSCWTCGIKFRKENAMKHHMKTVKHQLEAKKYTITGEVTNKSEVQVILIEADLLNEIQTVSTPQILTMEVPMTETNELIVTSENEPDIGPIIQLNTALENGSNLLNLEVGNTNKIAKICIDEDEQNATGNLDSDDPKRMQRLKKSLITS